MEYIYLQGSEDVKRASSEMTSAANEMKQAASDFRDSVDRLERLWIEVQEAMAAR